ncbi:helix-turn-helix domain-containing protein [Roseivirga misakiensis]|nr:helix-turn-helix domain-containing protein [Roseivirga misakiensis]
MDELLKLSTHLVNMKCILKRLALLFLYLTLGFESYGQNKFIDSLGNLSYYELDTYFLKTTVDTINDQHYGKAYLKKAKNENDIERIAYAYFNLSRSSNVRNAILYCDSAIFFSRELQNHEYLPASPYSQKATIYFELGDYEKALDDFLSALFYAKRGGNRRVELHVRANIATLKMITRNYKEALSQYKEYVDFIEENGFVDQGLIITNSIYQLANAYFRNDILDSTDLIISKGYPMAVSTNDTTLLAYFTLLSGANAFKKGNYQVAIDSLLIGKTLINEQYFRIDEFNAYANLYLGKSKMRLNDEMLGINYLEQVDNYVQNALPAEYDFLAIYELLINHHKDKGDLDKQLKYINHYIKADSVFRTKQGILENGITSGFEIANIYDQRGQLIKLLKNKNERSRRYLFVLIVIASIVLIILLYSLRLNRINKKKFKAIIDQIEEEKREQELLVSDTKANRPPNSGLSVELINEILRKLEVFEERDQFLENHTLPSLAKELNTNSTYLSKVINTYKSTNFSNYLNELRIKYSIKRLHEDRRFRMYTIEAIAKESGYNTAQSFSKAFQKKTRLKPSYFIQQLNAQKE